MAEGDPPTLNLTAKCIRDKIYKIEVKLCLEEDYCRTIKLRLKLQRYNKLYESLLSHAVDQYNKQEWETHQWTFQDC